MRFIIKLLSYIRIHLWYKPITHTFMVNGFLITVDMLAYVEGKKKKQDVIDYFTILLNTKYKDYNLDEYFTVYNRIKKKKDKKVIKSFFEVCVFSDLYKARSILKDIIIKDKQTQRNDKIEHLIC